MKCRCWPKTSFCRLHHSATESAWAQRLRLGPTNFAFDRSGFRCLSAAKATALTNDPSWPPRVFMNRSSMSIPVRGVVRSPAKVRGANPPRSWTSSGQLERRVLDRRLDTRLQIPANREVRRRLPRFGLRGRLPGMVTVRLRPHCGSSAQRVLSATSGRSTYSAIRILTGSFIAMTGHFFVPESTQTSILA